MLESYPLLPTIHLSRSCHSFHFRSKDLLNQKSSDVEKCPLTFIFTSLKDTDKQHSLVEIPDVMIKAILVFNNHGKPRLSKFYQHYVSYNLFLFLSFSNFTTSSSLISMSLYCISLIIVGFQDHLANASQWIVIFSHVDALSASHKYNIILFINFINAFQSFQPYIQLCINFTCLHKKCLSLLLLAFPTL